MREMLALQPRFQVMTGRRGINLLEHRRFRAAYDFMMLLSDVGLVDADVAKFWTDVQTQSVQQRVESFQVHTKPAGRPGRRRKRRRRPSSAQSE
jgi:poly(A) polymerase